MMEEGQIDDHPRKRVKLDDSITSKTTNGNGSAAPASYDQDDQDRRELRAGITHYINPKTSGFSGVLKQR